METARGVINSLSAAPRKTLSVRNKACGDKDKLHDHSSVIQTTVVHTQKSEQ